MTKQNRESDVFMQGFGGVTKMNRLADVTKCARRGAYRRRGSALILVVTVLGILFVTGVAFLTTIRFDATLLSLERQAGRNEVAVRQAGAITDTLLTESWLVRPGIPGGAVPLGANTELANPATGTLPAQFDVFKTAFPTYSELPVVHPLFSPIEPYFLENPPASPGDGQWVFGWFTDLKTLRNGPTAGSILGNYRYIDTSMRNFSVLTTYRLPTENNVGELLPFDERPTDPNAPLVADADGDGIVDAILVDLEELGVSPSQIAELNKIVQPPGIAGEKVNIATRIIPHGGMVNVSEAHPALIGNVMGWESNLPDDEFLSVWAKRLTVKTYSSQAEETSLRRRNILPSAQLPVTMIQGNPLADPMKGGDGDNIGEGHFSRMLFPPGESVLRNMHQYAPYDQTVGADMEEWTTRMNPDATEGYDLRHLVTTVSHDNLLARPTEVWVRDVTTGKGVALKTDAVSQMIAVNRGDGIGDCDTVFEYPNYPHSLPNVMTGSRGVRSANWCECSWSETDAPCKLDPRKGRMKMSLPWLDYALMDGVNEGMALDNAEVITADQRIQLIQEAFSLLLLNARGSEWGVFEPPPTPPPPADAPPTPAIWTWADQTGLIKLQRTAAALTANLIDFADADEIPTRVPVRSMDYGDSDNVGRELTDQYVFGLERQLFITEVAANAVWDPVTMRYDPLNSAYAVELFNPYSERFPVTGANTPIFWIRVKGDGPEIRVPQINGKGFLVIYSCQACVDEADAQSKLGNLNGIAGYFDATGMFVFSPGDTLYLIAKYSVQQNNYEVVVDQFSVPATLLSVTTTAPECHSLERARNSAVDMNSPVWPWFAPIPENVADIKDGTCATNEDAAAVHSLGRNNSHAMNNNLRPVQLMQANTGSIASAFPTTGSLLLLMRYGNRSIDDLSSGVTNMAWTTYLAADQTAIDNGRMPVFDVNNNPDAKNKHHVAPNDDPRNPGMMFPRDQPGDLAQLPWGQLIFDYFTALPLRNKGVWSEPDEIRNKPTIVQSAQPRVSQDGLQVDARIDINSAPASVLSGLPLMPMAKFPSSYRNQIRRAVALVPSNESNQYDPNLTQLAQVSTPDERASTIGPELAQAIVAYREARAIGKKPSANSTIAEYTGDYDTEVPQGYGRGWRNEAPAMRRGTGFLSVGELANIRHTAAGKKLDVVDNPRNKETLFDQPIKNWKEFSYYRIDGGFVDGGAEFADYVSAVGTLVALGDWVTTHSDVYTVYGTIWGSTSLETVPVSEFEDHALRFQETVDRLPVFLGKPTPVRIGQRVISRYKDIFRD
ncbi:MAG: hypothetical protein AABZ47_10955 [Planctomycetota bacterium]